VSPIRDACLATGSSDHTIKLWDALIGHSVGDPFKGHHGSVESVVFSLDGRHIASGSEDHTIRLWDAHGCCTDLNPSAASVALPSTFLPSEVGNNVDDTGTHHNVSHIFKDKPNSFYIG